MSTTRHSFVFSFAEKYTVLLLGIVATMVLSRLLTPAEVGVYSLGAVLVALAQVVRDFGVGQYLIQEKQLDMAKLRAALATSLLVAWLLAAMALLASAPLAQFYGEPRLTLVLRLLSVNFLLIPFSALTLPMLRRQLRFRAIYAINAANGLVNLLVAVTLALLGHSYMSMVWAALAGSCASLLVSLLLRPKELPWLPGRRGMGAIASFGAYSTGGGLVDEAGVAAPDLIIGKLIGIESLALFGKAQSVLNLFNQAITSAISPVVFPLFAARDREEKEKGGALAVYLRTVSYMTALAWPFFLFLACMALPLVKLLYGSQWLACVPLIRIMCLSSAVYSMFSMARYLLVATGQMRAQVRLDAWAGALKVALLLLAAPFGLVAVAWAVVASSVLRSSLSYACLRRHSGLHWRILLRAVHKSLALCLLSSAPPLLMLPWLPAELAYGSALLALAGTALASLLCWLAGVFLLKHEIGAEFSLLQRKLASRWMPVKSPH